MSQILIYFFIGISLSMDAFSLALTIGIRTRKKSIKFKTSCIIGLFHFFMPLIGNYLGRMFSKKTIIKPNLISFFIFLILSYEMIHKKDEKEKLEINNILSILILSLAVSMDSLTIGIVFGLNKENPYMACIIFSILSFIFTNLGFILGNYIQEKLQEKSPLIGAGLLFLMALKYLLKP